jgi:zinc protease
VTEPPAPAERRLRFGRPVPSERLLLGWRSPGHGDPDWPALDMVDKLLTGGPSSRLYKRLVVDEEVASAVDGGPLPFRDPSLYELSVHLTRDASADQVLAMVDEEVDRLRREPVGAAELDKVRSCVETDFWSALTTIDGRAEALGHHETTLGDFRSLFHMAGRLVAVDAGAIAAAASRWLDHSQRTVVVAEPLDAEAEADDEDEDA